MLNIVHLVLILTGAVLRVTYFMAGSMLNVSETHYAANILSRSFRDIIYHLQILPEQPLNSLGFYLVQKSIVTMAGESVFMLRIYPLLCSLLGLLLFYYLARYYLSAFGATMALAFFALSEWLIVSGSLVSPYAADVLTGLLAVFVFEQARRAEFRPRSMLVLAILGALSIWFSYSAILVWLAVMVCLTEQIISLRYVRRVPSLMGVISVWIVSFLCLYLVCLSHLIQSPYTWYRLQVSFSPAPYWSWETLHWTIGAFLTMFEHPVDLAFPLLGVIFVLAGVGGLVRRNPECALVLTLPIVITYLLAGYRLYPAFGHEVIFLLPYIYLLLAAGLAWVEHRFQRPGRWIGLVIFAALLIQPLTHLTDAFVGVRYAVAAGHMAEEQPHSIIMLGDSLFALNDWPSYFNRDGVINLGVVGNRINDVRVRVGEVPLYRPRKIFVMVGINDHPAEGNRADLIRRYRRLILELQRVCPQSRIYVSSLLPVNEQRMLTYFGTSIENEQIRTFNRALRRLAAERGVTFVDAHRAFTSDGGLNVALTTDGVHLNRQGYRVWRPWFIPHIDLD